MVTLKKIGELEAIAREGAVVVLKIDGERGSDPNIFTVMLSGGKLGSEDFFRMDGDSFPKLIDAAIQFYEAESKGAGSE